MTKDPSRKAARRVQKQPKIDDDLIELMSVLDEQRLVSNVEGWFTLPWRDGWNAAKLALVCYRQFKHRDDYRFDEISGTLTKWTGDRLVSPFIYENAGDFIIHIASAMVTRSETHAAGFLLASLRCVQLVVSNSSGGGATYNDVLRHRFERVPSHWPEMLKNEVRAARCHDAIGVGPMMANDRNDRLRRAFRIAWDRGLYQAAYALPRAI